MRAVSIFVIALVCLQNFVLAHYSIIYPGTRGFDEGKEPVGPCGGFDTVGSQRFSMPKSAFITINSGHVTYTYVVNALYSNNPSAADFSGANVKKVTEGSRSFPEAACLPVQFGNEVQDGTNATIQIIYNGGDGLLYQVSGLRYKIYMYDDTNLIQCIDVTIDSKASYNASMCYNADGSTTAIGGNNNASPSATPSNTTSKGSSVAATGLTLMLALGFSVLLTC
jgi:hypothetical protein